MELQLVMTQHDWEAVGIEMHHPHHRRHHSRRHHIVSESQESGGVDGMIAVQAVLVHAEKWTV